MKASPWIIGDLAAMSVVQNEQIVKAYQFILARPIGVQ